MCALMAVYSVCIAPATAFSVAASVLPAFAPHAAIRRTGSLQAHVVMSTGGGDKRPLVVVAGATGRVGRRVVQNLLNPQSANSTQTPVRVRALVRDLQKAGTLLPTSNPALEVVQCDLLSSEQLQANCGDAAAAVWCATGFSDSQDSSLLSKLMGAFKLKFTPQEAR